MELREMLGADIWNGFQRKLGVMAATKNGGAQTLALLDIS